LEYLSAFNVENDLVVNGVILARADKSFPRWKTRQEFVRFGKEKLQ
jgi:hypothetical protein